MLNFLQFYYRFIADGVFNITIIFVSSRHCLYIFKFIYIEFPLFFEEVFYQ